MFYFDPLYMVMMVAGLVMSLWATTKVKSNFAKYSKIPSSGGLTGAEVARRILQANGIHDVEVEPTRSHQFLGMGGDGIIDDHYDPRTKKVRLSPQVFEGNSQAAIGIAAHEVGHAIQHAVGYSAFKLRSTIAPAAALGSNMSYFFLMFGFIFHSMGMIKIGILMFSIAVVFQFITLPVEFDASRRAKKLLVQYNLASGSDAVGVAKVLDAAALTYVAAAAAALLNLIYFLIRSGLLNNRR
ncbi:MAG: zinc metallopeptidase [Deltaproteobacteria bacterium]|nr:zinc metallopeptidase [Deltaproteobacteria bacterium]